MGISVPQYKVTLSLRHTHTVSPPLIFSQTLQIHISHLSLPPSCQYTPGIMTNRVTLYRTSHTLIDKYTKSSKNNSVVTHWKTQQHDQMNKLQTLIIELGLTPFELRTNDTSNHVVCSGEVCCYYSKDQTYNFEKGRQNWQGKKILKLDFKLEGQVSQKGLRLSQV